MNQALQRQRPSRLRMLLRLGYIVLVDHPSHRPGKVPTYTSHGRKLLEERPQRMKLLNHSKRETLTSLWANYADMIDLIVVPHSRRQGLPVELEAEVVRLNVGHNLPIPTADLTCDEDGIRVTLSFNRTPSACFIPWEALAGVVAAGFAIQWQYLLPDDGAEDDGPPTRKLRVVK